MQSTSRCCWTAWHGIHKIDTKRRTRWSLRLNRVHYLAACLPVCSEPIYFFLDKIECNFHRVQMHSNSCSRVVEFSSCRCSSWRHIVQFNFTYPNPWLAHWRQYRLSRHLPFARQSEFSICARVAHERCAKPKDSEWQEFAIEPGPLLAIFLSSSCSWMHRWNAHIIMINLHPCIRACAELRPRVSRAECILPSLWPCDCVSVQQTLHRQSAELINGLKEKRFSAIVSTWTFVRRAHVVSLS